MVQAESLGALGIREGFVEESLTETGDFCPDLVCCKCSSLILLLAPRSWKMALRMCLFSCWALQRWEESIQTRSKGVVRTHPCVNAGRDGVRDGEPLSQQVFRG